MKELVFLGLAGGLGTLARYGLAGAVQRAFRPDYPFGTMSVNILGSLLFGFVWALCEERSVLTPELRAIILTGFMGAFTTFSTFMFETGTLVRSGSYGMAMLNVSAQTTLGLLMVFAGMTLAKAF